MAKVLYVVAHPLDEERSYSLSMGRAFIDSYKKVSPEDEIVELNLYKEYIPEIDADILEGWAHLGAGGSFGELRSEQQTKIARINELTDQFIDADKYVFVSPLWNYTIPARFKAYIDTFLIARKTFKYTENGSVGLMTGKRAVHLQARGGIYTVGPMKDAEHGDSLLRTALDLIGVELETIVAEGHAYQPELAEKIKHDAIENAVSAAERFANDLVKS
ncbi:NAD(P)H-dependent oxidoreductase [Metabacillus malikii]|uniref:FMN dependent NADH:quinone oxidoreductase n=1 Tax=Metabacillus malikii TaxID=1504265 RepID=A0ABT9ZP94_9BACI|nr:NAD(P)H-dependent oxidoreductase [Metabacillus malikii]MDQ0233343.1 FMN-dependent NADH-azoreductase [Metabacillus malikii]